MLIASGDESDYLVIDMFIESNYLVIDMFI